MGVNDNYDVGAQQKMEADKYGIPLVPVDPELDNGKAPAEVNNGKGQLEDEQPLKKNDEDESESEEEEIPDKKKDESEDEPEDKTPEAKRPPKGSLANEAFKQREQQRLGKIVDERLTAALSPVMEMLQELKTAKTPEEKKEVVENIDDQMAEIAKAENIPLDQFKKIAGLLQKQIEAGLAPKLKQLEQVAPALEREREAEQIKAIETELGKEWEEQAEPILVDQYKNASPKQMKEARELLATLAVSAKYGDTRGNQENLPEHPAYPVDYILYKEAAQFDTILNSPKKKTFEHSNSISDENNDEPKGLDNLYQDKVITSAEQALKLDRNIQKTINTTRSLVAEEGQSGQLE